MFRFFDRHFTEISDFFAAVESWQRTVLLEPLHSAIQPFVNKASKELRWMRFRFAPQLHIHDSAAYSSSQNTYYCQSKRRSPQSAIRRFAFGTQVRGLHIHIQDAPTMLKHVELATRAAHPCLDLPNQLDGLWKEVFSYWTAPFHQYGIDDTMHRVVEHRSEAMSWISRLADDLRDLSAACSASMPPSSQLIASHLNLPLFYVLLKATDFPNPDLAWRPFLGAPLVGEFYSPALTERHAISLKLVISLLQ